MDFYLLDNSNNYRVRKLRDETGELVSDANLTVEIRLVDPATDSSAQVTGAVWPLSFVSEGLGDYRVNLPPGLGMEPGQQYKAIIEGTVGGRTFRETRNVFAKRRLTV